MTRLFLVSIAFVGALAVVPYAGEARKGTPKKGAPPRSNQVYVKIILPIDPEVRHKDQPVVESWIAEQLRIRGQSKLSAATEWVPLDDKRAESTLVWSGSLDGKSWGCPVYGDINGEANGRVKVCIDGWAPEPGFGVAILLKDEPGSREIVAVEKLKSGSGTPYVVVLIGPPHAKPAAPSDNEK